MSILQRMAIALVVVLGIGLSLIAILELEPVRNSWQRPGEVVAALALQPGDTVADIGAGGGYFVPHLAEAVGAAGRVYAVDVEAEIAEDLRSRFAEDARVEVVLGEYEDPLLPDAAIDLVVLVNTFHHIQNRVDYFSRLRSDLSANGRVAVIEPNAALEGFFSLFTNDEHVSFAESVAAEMRAAGYGHSTSHDFLPVQVFDVFVVEKVVERVAD